MNSKFRNKRKLRRLIGTLVLSSKSSIRDYRNLFIRFFDTFFDVKQFNA